MKKCADIVVTYNRKELLKENIAALMLQSSSDHDIIIIDNASTDGTEKMIKSEYSSFVQYYNTGSNLGGAGGFSYGLKVAYKSGYDYAWLMDDDSIPDNDALESLLNKAALLNNNFSFLSSLVYWIDGNIFPMNFPHCDYKSIHEFSLSYLKEYRLLPITGGSFVGCFVNLSFVQMIGLPIADFFIYGDDQEYTHRLKKIKPCFLDLDSAILHKAPSNKGSDIVTASEERINRFYFQSRNGMYIAKKDKTVVLRFGVVLKRFINVVLHAHDHKLYRLWMLVKGTVAGLFYNPTIEFPASKKK